jgi:hypothetical protein
MSKRFSILLIFLTIASGLVGGIISGRIFAPQTILAEEGDIPPEIMKTRRLEADFIMTKEIYVVDQNKNILMSFGKDHEIFRHSDGKISNWGIYIYNEKGFSALPCFELGYSSLSNSGYMYINNNEERINEKRLGISIEPSSLKISSAYDPIISKDNIVLGFEEDGNPKLYVGGNQVSSIDRDK